MALTANQLVSQGFKGYQGWGDAEANADFNATKGAGKMGSTGNSTGLAPTLGTDFMQGLGSSRAAFNQGQAGQQSDFLNRYTGAIQGLETPQALATRLGSELGLPALNKSAFGLNQTLADIPSVQTTATRGFDVNANQLARIIAAKQAQIAPLAQRATAEAQFAQNELGNQMGFEQAGQERQLMPFQTEQQLLSDRLAREASGYSQDMTNELDLYLNRVARGEKLSDQETARAQQLADQENDFEKQKEMATFNTNENIRQARALKANSGGSTIANYLGQPNSNMDPMSGKSLSSIVGF